MTHAVEQEFKQLDASQSRVVLIDPGDRVLRAMHPSLSEAAGHHLQKVGVELVLGGRVQSIREGEVVVNLKDPDGSTTSRTIAGGTVCWTAGVRASHLGKLLAERTGCDVDRGGRVVVEHDFSIADHPEIRVVGDLCSYSHTADGKPLPGMAGPAVQMGTWVARDIVARSQGNSHPPFRFLDFGSMAVIGRTFAVADLRGFRVSGTLGWLLWGLAHLAFMPDTENRVTLLIKWLWQITTNQRASLLITGHPNQHMGVEVGLERRELAGDPAAAPAPRPAVAETAPG
jgi:NADH dehydrogenase